MNKTRRGILVNRRYTIVVLLFFSYESVAAWLRIPRYSRFPHDPLHIFGLAFVIFCCASLTFRSPSSADRIAFGAATLAVVLCALTMASLSPFAMAATQASQLVMWIIAVATCLTVLGRSLNNSKSKS